MSKKLDQAIKEQTEHHNLNYGVDDDDPYTVDDAIDDLMDECGKDRNGHCSMVGSEYCDFECPFR